MKIDKAFEIIEDNIEESDFVGKIKDESIRKLEELLNIVLPYSYKKFIQNYGCGDIFGIEIYGIVSDDKIQVEGVPSLYWLIKELRKDGLNNNYIPFSETGDGNYFILDSSNINEKNEHSVYIWSPGNLLSKKVSSSFASFLYNTLKEYE
jgi:hypothetical protein